MEKPFRTRWLQLSETWYIMVMAIFIITTRKGEANMSRKILSVLLVLCMVLSMVPVAMAAETDPAETNPAATEPAETQPEETKPEETKPEETQPEETKPVFTDVAKDDWFAEEVMWAYEQGLVKGTTETTFAPDLAITRGMVVTVLHRYEKEPKVEGTQFSDVNRTMYYAMPILWASSEEIVTGYDKTTFGPDDGITREQIAAILYRYAKYKKLDVSVSEDASLKAFTDAAKVSDYAKEAMLWAVDAKLINGMTATTLEPQGNATRAQVATLLYRLFTEAIDPPHTHAYGDWAAKDGKTHIATCANTDGKCDKLTISENCVYTKSTEKCDVCEFADGKVHIATAEQLVAFAAKVNGDEKTPGDNHEGKTVQLEADIDLKGVEWAPIGANFEKAFCGTFDGQKHTVSNLNVAGVEYVGLFGAVNGVIKDLTVDGALVTGNHWVGGIVGYAYGEITGCAVKNATITAAPNNPDNKGYDNGDKVGGIVGYLASEPVGIISKCAVENVEISAYRDAGGVAGMVNTGEGAEASITENTVTKVTITIDQSRFYGYKTPNAGAIVGRMDIEDTGIKLDKNTETDVTISIGATTADNKPVAADVSGTAYSDVAAALKIAAQTEDAVLTILKSGSYTMPDSFAPGVTVICRVEGVTFSIPRSDVDGMYRVSAKNFKLRNATIDTEITFTGSGVFENVEFTGVNGIRKANLYGDCAFIGCTFPATDMYAFQADWISGDVTFDKCELTGMVSYEGLEEYSVTFNECVFKSNGKYGKLTARYIPTVLSKCDISAIEVDYTAALFQVDGEYIITNEEQLHTAAAIPEATLDLQIVLEEEEEVFTLNQDLVLAEKVTVNGNDTVINAENYQIVTAGGTIKNLSLVGKHNGLVGSDLTSDLTLEGVTVDEGDFSVNIAAGNGKKLIVKNSKLYGEMDCFNLTSAAFTGCTFGQGKSNNQGYLLMGCVTTFADCTFDKGFKLGALAISEEAAKALSVKLTNCTSDGTKLTADSFAKLMVKKLEDDPFAATLKSVTVTVDSVAVGASSYT